MSADSSTLCRQVTTLTGSFSSMRSPAEHSWGQGRGEGEGGGKRRGAGEGVWWNTHLMSSFIGTCIIITLN